MSTEKGYTLLRRGFVFTCGPIAWTIDAQKEQYFFMASLEAANVGRAVAARVGGNMREVRTKLSLTQSQLASPEFSISYISAIERGKIRPSLKALPILARRLDVPLTFLLEGSPAGTMEARAAGFSPADAGPDQRLDVALLQASVLVHQHFFQQASEVLASLQPERMTTD